MGIAYGYQLYATRPTTRPEVKIDGWWMSGIAAWGDLRTSTRLTGDWEASWSFIRPPTRQTLRHPALHHGAPVEVMLGPIPVWVGSLIEPDWDSGDLVAMGAPRQGEDAQALTAAGQTTTKPDVAIDQAIARGVLNWTRGHTFGATAIGEADDVGDLSSVARLLDAWATDADNPSGWRVDRQRVLHAVDNNEAADPAWFITPGSGELGVADDERADRIFLRYSDNTVGGALRTASYPATTPAGGVERRGAVINLGPVSPAKATRLARGIWRRMNGHSGWTNGLKLTRSQVTTTGGLPANLALIKAGDTMRLLGVPDPRGLAHHLDVVIGETDLDWEAGEIQVNPVGLAARTFEAVLEEVVPGATAA